MENLINAVEISLFVMCGSLAIIIVSGTLLIAIETVLYLVPKIITIIKDKLNRLDDFNR